MYVLYLLSGDNILTAISVGRDCELIKPDQTVIRVEAELGPDSYMPNLNVSYTLEETSNIVHDVSQQKQLVVTTLFSSWRHFWTTLALYVLQSNFIRSVQERNYVFACDGKTFAMIRNNDRALLDRIVQRGKIFARMLPEQKIHLIECMKDLG